MSFEALPAAPPQPAARLANSSIAAKTAVILDFALFIRNSSPTFLCCAKNKIKRVKSVDLTLKNRKDEDQEHSLVNRPIALSFCLRVSSAAQQPTCTFGALFNRGSPEIHPLTVLAREGECFLQAGYTSANFT